MVIEPGPKSVATNTLSLFRHATWLLASGRVYPFFMNAFFVRSNSRTALASAPPRDRDTRASLYSGFKG